MKEEPVERVAAIAKTRNRSVDALVACTEAVVELRAGERALSERSMDMNSVLQMNEQQANKVVAKVMRITFLIFAVVFGMNIAGIFVVDQTIMNVAFVAGSIFLWLPTALGRIGNGTASCIKYLNVICASLFILLTTITLSFHVIVIYVYAIAIASLYFSKRLNVLATVVNVIGVSVGQILAFQLNSLPDENFDTMYDVVIYSVVPRALTLVAIAAIFTMLCSRTASMLGNLMGAEEQKEMLERMTKFQEQNSQVSKQLFSLVEELEHLSEVSNETNRKVAAETEEIMRGTKDNAGQIQGMNDGLIDITERMTQLEDMSDRLAKAAEQIRTLSAGNQRAMESATESMLHISDSAGECKKVIETLGEQSNEIMGIIQTITDISARTKMLALNATIEAARAGEHGRGFAVVAEEIQKLSEQTQTAVESIGAIVNEVVESTKEAVTSMEQSARLNEQGLLQIKEVGESTNTITEANEEMTAQIDEVDRITKILLETEKQVAGGMEQVHQNTEVNLSAVEHVADATKESSNSTESLVDMVRRIKNVARELNGDAQ